jgi:phenylacetate-CoA ligase
MNFIPHIELQSPAEIQKFQLLKLKEVLLYLQHCSPFYKRLFEKHNISERSVNTWDDLNHLPTTSKDDLQQYNWDFLCVPRSEIVEYTCTSGTLGKPVTIALTEKDIQRLGYNECISFACAGGSEHDVYQLMLTLDRQFMAGIAYYEGIRKLGAALVRTGPGLPGMQWETIQRLKSTTLVAVPSFVLKLIEFAQQHQMPLEQSSVKKIICIGENIRSHDFSFNTIGRKIKDEWDVELYSTYASTEMQTAFTECSKGRGGHQHPELIIVEFLDENNNTVKEGEAGEVTITTLGVEGMPLLRYKTGDIAQAYTDVCACGRATVRLSPIVGRKQQMVKLKGTTLYPPGIFDILNEVQGIQDFTVEVFTNSLGTDELRLHILVQDIHKQQTETSLRSVFQSRLRVVPEICFTDQATIESMQQGGINRKIKKFIDHR